MIENSFVAIFEDRVGYFVQKYDTALKYLSARQFIMEHCSQFGINLQKVWATDSVDAMYDLTIAAYTYIRGKNLAGETVYLSELESALSTMAVLNDIKISKIFD